MERCQITVAKPSEALQVCAGASQSFGGENLRRGAGPVVAQRTHTRWLGRQGWEVSAKLRMPPPFSPLAPILAARRSRGAGWRPRCLRKTEGAFSPELSGFTWCSPGEQTQHLPSPHGPEVGGHKPAR